MTVSSPTIKVLRVMTHSAEPRATAAASGPVTCGGKRGSTFGI